MSAAKKNVIIVGAGLVGSLWAIYLAKRGYKVDVYERRGDMRSAGFIGGRSINLAMSHRGWRALRGAGIEKEIRKVAIPLGGRMMHSTQGNLTFQPYGKSDQAIYSVSRGGLNLELINLAESYESVDFHFNWKCERLDYKTLELRFSNSQTKEKVLLNADLIFGTDGAFSSVRGSLQKTPGFNYSQSYLEHGYKELSIPANPDGSHKLDTNSLHIWPRGQFMLIALPNLDGTFTCTLFLPFKGEESFENLKSDASISSFFDKYFSDAVPLMPDLISDFQDNPTSALVTIRCNPWTYMDKVLLIGDASHAIVPFYGQGMNSGFEDCTILGGLMEQYNDDWKTILNVFNKERVKDGNAIADLAVRNFIEMRDLVADPAFLLRKKIGAWLHEKFPEKFIPVYSMVTFTDIPYSRALEESFRQDELFLEILSIDGINENWRSEKVENVFLNWYQTKIAASPLEPKIN